MSLLPPIEIESELSYAFLHAVAAKAGMSCESSNRHADKMGIDAVIRASEVFSDESVFTDFPVEVQLKATTQQPTIKDGKMPYFLKGVDRYDKLRQEKNATPRILVVLFLPENKDEWLQQTKEQLIIKRCAWWVCLKGANESQNNTGQTIYIPVNQVFDVAGLREIMTRISKQEDLRYEKE